MANIQQRYIITVTSVPINTSTELMVKPSSDIYEAFGYLPRLCVCGFFLKNNCGMCAQQVLDYLAIAVHELASLSERRIERLVNPALSSLPAFLVLDGGLNSGFMMAHCTAASLGVTSI